MQKIHLSKVKKEKLKKLLKKYKDVGKTYAQFSSCKKDAYLYTTTIGLRACPYCNINHVYTVYNNPKHCHDERLRPDIEHFETQKESTNLTLEQNNLIPVCQQCNSRVKLRKSFSSKTHIHPYLDDFNGIMIFTIQISATNYLDTNSFDIYFESKHGASKSDIDKANNSIRDLALVERYHYHKEDIVDVFKKAKYYGRYRIKEIEKLVKAKDLEIALFSHRDEDINQAPLSKLKNDILEIIL